MSPALDGKEDEQADLSDVEDEAGAKVTQGAGMGILSPSGGQAQNKQNLFEFNDEEDANEENDDLPLIN